MFAASPGNKKLTFTNGRDRMPLTVIWARSSMVEQCPFKPLVTGSSPVALIIIDGELIRFLTTNAGVRRIY